MRCFFISLGLLCVGALAVAFSAEHFWGHRPCILCVYAQYLYGTLGLLALIGMRWRPRLLWWLCMGVLMAGVALSLYHLGVEHHWWLGPDKCRTQGLPDSLEALRQHLKTARPRCDEVGMRLLGISATLWNAIIFGLMLLAGGLFKRREDHAGY